MADEQKGLQSSATGTASGINDDLESQFADVALYQLVNEHLSRDLPAIDPLGRWDARGLRLPADEPKSDCGVTMAFSGGSLAVKAALREELEARRRDLRECARLESLYASELRSAWRTLGIDVK